MAMLQGLLALMFAWMAHSAGAATSFTLDTLMQTLASKPSGEARFHETRRVSALEQTLQSSGRLAYVAPDRFLRETLKPRHEKLSVDGNTLTMLHGQRTRTMQLDSVPEAQVMVEAIRGTLTGNAAVLQRHFDTRLQGDGARWQLELTPKDARLRGTVRQIEIQGRQAEVLRVQLSMADGDSSVMQIEPVSAAAPAASSR